MNVSVDPTTTLAIIAFGMAAFGYVVGVATAFGCDCPRCSVHVEEKRVAREAKRVAEHRRFHSYWRTPWGDKDCTACRNGGDRDRER